MSNAKGFLGLDKVVVDELKEKWAILLIAFITVIFAFSLPAFAPQNIYDYLEADFGWSRAQITALATSKYLTGFIIAVTVGIVIDKVGVKKVLIVVSAIGALAMTAFYFVPNLPTYYMIGIMLGMATTGSIVCLKVLIGRSYEYAVGLAMGVTLAGMSVGQMIVPFLINIFVPENDPEGWRIGMLELSLFIWFIAIPTLVFGLREKQLEHSKQEKSKGGEANLTWKDLLSEGRFWLIALAVFLVGFVDQAYIQNARFFLVADLGITTETYALVIFWYAMAGIVSRPALGWLIDLISVKGVSIAYTVLAATSLLALPLAAAGPLMIYLWMVLRGVSHSGVMLDSAMLSKHCYGRHNLGLLIGLLTGIINIGFATGPVMMGWISDATGSYNLAHVIYGVLALVAAGIVLLVKPSYWIASQEERAAKLAEDAA